VAVPVAIATLRPVPAACLQLAFDFHRAPKPTTERRKRPLSAKNARAVSGLVTTHTGATIGTWRSFFSTWAMASAVRIRKRPDTTEWEVVLVPPVNAVLPVSRRQLRALWAAFE